MVLNEGAPVSTLHSWADARHKVWKDIVDPTSTENLKRCLNTDPDNPKEDFFLRLVLENSEQLKAVNHTFDKEMITRMREIVV